LLTTATFNNYLPNSHKVSSLYLDREKNIFFLNKQGTFFKIDNNEKKGYPFTTEEKLLPKSSFVFQDAEKNYWIASFGNGVQKLQQSFFSKIVEIDKNQLQNITAWNKDEKGNYFIQTQNNLYLNDKLLQRNKAQYSNNIFFWQGQFWYFKDYKTLVSSKNRVYHIAKYLPNYKPADFQPSNSSIDKMGRLIISGSTIFIISPDYTFTAIKPPYYCDNILVDNDNNYWAFCRSNDAVKYQWKNNRLEVLFTKKIFNLNPRFTTFIDTNLIVCGTRNRGILFLKWDKNDIKIVSQLDKSNGLSNNFVYTLHKKNNNEFLAGTATGLDIIRFSKRDTIIENISLRNNFFSSFPGIIETKDSAILCIKESGELYMLQKKTSINSNLNPIVFFRKIMVENKEIDNEHIFDYTASNFYFSVSAPSFIDNKSIKFTFLLQSEAQQWKQQGTEADFTINNLLPGNYKLSVIVEYPGKFYPDKQIFYNFTIKKPFWKQWWFIFLLGFTALGIIFLLIRFYYMRQLEKQKIVLEKQQAVEKERTRIATDMHDDLGSGLTKITYLSQMALNKESNKDDLQSIKQTSTDLVESMNEIIWAMKEENNTIEDLIYHIKSYTIDYCTSNNLNCTINLPEKLYPRIVAGQNRRNIYLAVKEALHNIVKHAQAKNVVLTASFTSQWILSIKDDGIGFTETTQEKHIGGNGLKNIYKRIEAVRGSVEIKDNNGTELIFYIPL
jgi:signal transduction histidine kinase